MTCTSRYRRRFRHRRCHYAELISEKQVVAVRNGSDQPEPQRLDLIVVAIPVPVLPLSLSPIHLGLRL